MKKEENFYELLKVDRKATVSEIVTAYHSAKNAFSKDSLAIYSLFTAEETEEVLKKLEEAYLTLSNLDRKREYDKKIGGETSASPEPQSAEPQRPSFVTVTIPGQSTPRANSTTAPVPPPAPVSYVAPPSASLASPLEENVLEITTPPDAAVNGAWLRGAREQHGMTIEDVSRLTKIPLSTLKAIETDNLPKLPARVYLQGFVSNLLKVYKIDSKATKLYLETIDRLLRPPTMS
jgi:flagellar biosynthesis protein FlhG